MPKGRAGKSREGRAIRRGRPPAAASVTGPVSPDGRRFWVKTYTETGDLLVAAADAELLGQVFREPERGLRLEVSEGFYRGVEVGEETLRDRLRDGTILNLVGTRTIGIAKALGLVDDAGIISIGGVPHAQVVFIPQRLAASA